MSQHQPELSRQAQSLNWLVANFVRKIPGVAHTIAVSADGLLMAVSERLVARCGDVPTPALRAELRAALPR